MRPLPRLEKFRKHGSGDQGPYLHEGGSRGTGFSQQQPQTVASTMLPKLLIHNQKESKVGKSNQYLPRALTKGKEPLH